MFHQKNPNPFSGSTNYVCVEKPNVNIWQEKKAHWAKQARPQLVGAGAH